MANSILVFMLSPPMRHGIYTAKVTMDHTPSRVYLFCNSRPIVLCFEEDQQKKTIEYMSQKLKNSGYKADEIAIARNKGTIFNQNMSKVAPDTKHQLRGEGGQGSKIQVGPIIFFKLQKFQVLFEIL